ncbi:MAG: hypothetical protein UY62_C0002G0019 [Parcubacteria group bacterium GW2011_GWF2_50_9]|nr:MAG: hypothetical protein UY62_C0002G0019 [Parcubacteria group bacterium GW2011_GWF2_50_9]
MAIFCLIPEQIATFGPLPRKLKHLGRKTVGLFSNVRICEFALFFRFEPSLTLKAFWSNINTISDMQSNIQFNLLSASYYTPHFMRLV